MKSVDTDYPPEEDDNNNEKMNGQFQADSADKEFAQDSDNAKKDEKIDDKKMKRILANRRSARASYQRRRRMFSSLETTITSLRKENTDLVDDNKKLSQQVMLLQQQLSISLMPNNQIGNNIGMGGPMDMKSLALQQLAAEHLHQQQQQQLLQNHTQQQGFLQNHAKPHQLQDFQQQQLMHGQTSEESGLAQSSAFQYPAQLNQDLDQVILERMLKGENPNEKAPEKG